MFKTKYNKNWVSEYVSSFSLRHSKAKLMKKTLALGLTATLGFSGGMGLMSHTYAADMPQTVVENLEPLQALHSQLANDATFLVTVQESYGKAGTIATVPIYLDNVDTTNGFSGATLTLTTKGASDSIVFDGFDTDETLFESGVSASSDENMKINVASSTPITTTGILVKARFRISSDAIPGSSLTIYANVDFTDGTSTEIPSVASKQAKLTVLCSGKHQFSNPVYESGTCLKAGSSNTTCEICGWTLKKYLPKRPHMLDLEDEGTGENLGKYRCKTCGQHFALSYNDKDVYTILKYDVGLIPLTSDQINLLESDDKAGLDTGDAVRILQTLNNTTPSGGGE